MIKIITSPELKTWDGKEMVPSGGRVIVTVDADTLVAADLSKTDLSWAYLPHADLRRVNFCRATLTAANLSHANLCGATLERAYMMAANLMGADLADTYLGNAILVGARLQGADLRYAVLQGTELRFARYDETTLWPEGFDPQAAGAKLPSQIREWVL